jgi:hypothetical protein
VPVFFLNAPLAGAARPADAMPPLRRAKNNPGRHGHPVGAKSDHVTLQACLGSLAGVGLRKDSFKIEGRRPAIFGTSKTSKKKRPRCIGRGQYVEE